MMLGKLGLADALTRAEETAGVAEEQLAVAT